LIIYDLCWVLQKSDENRNKVSVKLNETLTKPRLIISNQRFMISVKELYELLLKT